MSRTKCPHCGEALDVRIGKAQNRPRPYDHDRALALLAFGATVSEVAELCGVSPQAISALKKRAAT